MEKYKKIIFDETLKNASYINSIRNKVFFITGCTGLIGSYICSYLEFLNFKFHLNNKIIGCARSKEKFDSFNFDSVSYFKYDLNDRIIKYDGNIDYIIHTASPTQSNYFIKNPVETIKSSFNAFETVLTFAKEKKVKSMVFLSTMEVYGICCSDVLLCEDDCYPINSCNIRNSYPEVKRLLECLACSYYSEYNLPVKIVRLSQTFGPGIDKNDNRVFAQFLRNALAHENIILKSKGDTKRSYCSIPDCINGILHVLISGENAYPYNLASDNSFIDIVTLANYFCLLANVKIEYNCDNNNSQYLPTIKFGLDTKRIKGIGFKSVMDIEKTIYLLYESENEKNNI